MEKTATLPRLTDEDAAAEYPGDKSPASMPRDHALKRGPRFAKLGHHVRYRIENLEAYVYERLVEPASAGAPANPEVTSPGIVRRSDARGQS